MVLRFLAYWTILVALGGVPVHGAASVGAQCVSRALIPSADFERVNSLVSSYSGGRLDNRFFPDADHRLRKNDIDFRSYARHALALTPEERSALAKRIKRNAEKERGFDDESVRVALLGLGDEKTWLEYIERVASYGGSKVDLMWLAEFLQKAPESLREKLLKEILKLYPTAAKRTVVRTKLGPKRAFDMLLHHLNPTAPEFVSLSVGENAYEVFGNFLGSLHRHFPKGSSFGRYDQAFIDRLLLTMQRYLKEIDARGESEIVFLGSFPNGVGNLKSSDVDLWVQNKTIHIVRKSRFGKVTRAFDPRLDRAVRQVFGVSPKSERKLLENAATKVPPGVPLGHFGVVNPLAFRIRPDRIELIYFPAPQPKKRGLKITDVSQEKIFTYLIPE